MSRKVIDWEALELQYRAGIRSLKDIGKEFDVSDAAIIKRARRDGWDRDLKAKIQAKADAKVSASLVSIEVSERKKLTESAIIEAVAVASATVQITQRTDIKRARDLNMVLLAEIEMQADPPQERTKTMKAWTESFRALITMEREAYGIQTVESSKEMTVRLLPSDAGLL
jgi:hypothetical protein